jgi:hypothetical protein
LFDNPNGSAPPATLLQREKTAVEIACGICSAGREVGTIAAIDVACLHQRRTGVNSMQLPCIQKLYIGARGGQTAV